MPNVGGQPTLKPESDSATGSSQAAPNIGGFGLHQLRKPESDLVIIFVHGVLSGGEAAWGRPSWPELVATEPDLKGAGVFVFSYQTTLWSGTYSIGDAVDFLREHFNLEHLWGYRRLLFVCHSMGGIIVRRFVVVNQAQLMERSCAVGLFLVASPSLGAKDANLISLLASVLQQTQLLALRFSQTNTWLNDLDREFMTLKESRRLLIVGKELVEDRPIVLKRWFGMRGQIVEPFAAGRYFGEVLRVPGSDHISISKPEARDAIQHRVLNRFISEFNQAIQENLTEFEKANRATEDAIASSSAKKEVKQVLRDLHTGIKHAALRSSLDGAELLLQTFASYVQEAIKERPSSFKLNALAKRLIDTLADYGREIATPIVELLIHGIQEFDDIEFEP